VGRTEKQLELSSAFSSPGAIDTAQGKKERGKAPQFWWPSERRRKKFSGGLSLSTRGTLCGENIEVSRSLMGEGPSMRVRKKKTQM